jgi:hypothetical protein
MIFVLYENVMEQGLVRDGWKVQRWLLQQYVYFSNWRSRSGAARAVLLFSSHSYNPMDRPDT